MAAPFKVKTAAQMRDDGLRTLRNGLIAIGVPAPLVSPGSDFYVEFQAIANELEVAASNLVVKADQLMPDSATGADLDRYAAMLGLKRRPASGAQGFITNASSADVSVVVGQQLVAGDGLRYGVSVGGTYANGALIPIGGVDTGAASNKSTGDVLRWVIQPAFADSKVLVAAPGLTGASDAEDDETLRTRVLARLQVTPGGGNWSDIAELAEKSSPLVQKAFVYPATRGPSTLSVAVAGYATKTAKTRDVASTVMTSTVTPYVVGKVVEHADVNCTTVANQTTDVSVGLGLPAAPTASPPGPGGGWANGTPWPAIDVANSITRAVVSSVTSTTQIKIDAAPGVAPTAGVTQVCYLAWQGTTAWTLYTATVTGFVGESPAGTYEVVLDKPFPDIAVGDYVFPASVNVQKYVDALLQAFALMGPGEKTSNIPIRRRAFRRPDPSLLWPYSLGDVQLRSLSDAGKEVLTTKWHYRQSETPTVPSTITDAPNILVPKRIGFYPA